MTDGVRGIKKGRRLKTDVSTDFGLFSKVLLNVKLFFCLFNLH